MHGLLALVSLAIAVQQASAAVPVWGQCGGLTFHGETACVPGATCKVLDKWYSQCKPDVPAAHANGNKFVTSTLKPGATPAANAVAVNKATGIDAKFKAKGKKFWGNIADPYYFNRPEVVSRLQSDFGQVTPENSMKWDATEPSPNRFTFTGSDAFVNWAVSNGKLIRGHTLVWAEQLPDWVKAINDKKTLTNAIQNHIANVAGRYKGKIYAWDVINEIFTDAGTLRDNVFNRVLGESFVKIAFEAARKADPNAKLYINDFSLDSNNRKVQGLVAMVKRVNSGGKFIDGIGSQTHLGPGGSGGVQAALNVMASAGVEVAITELDIAQASPQDYATVVRACLAVPACVSITSWGVSDKDSWRKKENASPLLFDANFKPKAAYNAVMQALS